MAETAVEIPRPGQHECIDSESTQERPTDNLTRFHVTKCLLQGFYNDNGEAMNPETQTPALSNSSSQPATDDSQGTIDYDADISNDEIAAGDAAQPPLPTDNVS